MQHTNFLPGFVYDGHAPFGAVPKLFTLLLEHGSCCHNGLRACCGCVVKHGSLVVDNLGAVDDMKKVAWHWRAPCWNEREHSASLSHRRSIVIQPVMDTNAATSI